MDFTYKNKKFNFEWSIEEEININSWFIDTFTILHFISAVDTKEANFFELNSPENKVHSSERVGYLFPKQTLFSKVLDYAHKKQSEGIKRYALNCLSFLYENISFTDDDDVLSLNTLEKIFPNENSCFAIFHNKSLIKLDYSTNNFIPFLYTKGYFLYNNGIRELPDIEKRYFENDFKSQFEGDKKLSINLMSTSSVIMNNDFFLRLFTQDLISNNNHLVRFFLVYQIFEFFFNIKKYNYLFNFIEKKDKDWLKRSYTNSENFSKIFMDDYESKTENNIIKELLQELNFENFNTDIDTDMQQILGKEYINLSTNSVDKQTKSEKHLNLKSNIYPLRNRIVHNLRNIDYSSDNVIKVCWWFEINMIKNLVDGKFDRHIIENS